MIEKLSFTDNIIYSILKNAHNIVPGIDYVVGIYYCYHQQTLKCYENSCTNGKHRIEEMSFDKEPDAVNNEREKSAAYSWTNRESIPFSIIQKNHKQIELEDELKNNVLILRFKNKVDNRYDLIIFYFRENMSNFELSHSDDPLSTSNKSIIGRLLYNSISMMLMLARKDMNIYNSILEAQQVADKMHKQFYEELKTTKRNYFQSIIRYCNHQVTRISDKDDIEYVLTEEAVNKLGEYQGDFEHLEAILEKAATIAANRSFDIHKGRIYINDTDIIFHDYKSETTQAEKEVYDRYAKTKEFMDRYETAAMKVISKNLPLTGINVGGHCSPAITPAAISDALKNHRRKILSLFEKYPDKWPVIRSEFRPVRNILAIKYSNDQSIAS
ncbi:MAG: hypothetical protein ABII90_15585 [Bacteroidota bacterium]